MHRREDENLEDYAIRLLSHGVHGYNAERLRELAHELLDQVLVQNYEIDRLENEIAQLENEIESNGDW